MPDHRHHRGPHPEDVEQFGPDAVPALRRAAADLAWLLGRGYAPNGTLKLVGDRYNLTQRQRTAVMRATCDDDDQILRRVRQVAPERIAGQCLLVDGYNLLTTIEAALGGGAILACRDGTYRDMASIHGTYRKVEETTPAIESAGRAMADAGIVSALWYLDSPVSNSGRLKAMIQEMALARGWDWRVELVVDPDYILSRADQPIATADSVILGRCQAWVNLARHIIEKHVPEAWVIDLSGHRNA